MQRHSQLNRLKPISCVFNSHPHCCQPACVPSEGWEMPVQVNPLAVLPSRVGWCPREKKTLECFASSYLTDENLSATATVGGTPTHPDPVVCPSTTALGASTCWKEKAAREFPVLLPSHEPLSLGYPGDRVYCAHTVIALHSYKSPISLPLRLHPHPILHPPTLYKWGRSPDWLNACSLTLILSAPRQ